MIGCCIVRFHGALIYGLWRCGCLCLRRGFGGSWFVLGPLGLGWFDYKIIILGFLGISIILYGKIVLFILMM